MGKILLRLILLSPMMTSKMELKLLVQVEYYQARSIRAGVASTKKLRNVPIVRCTHARITDTFSRQKRKEEDRNPPIDRIDQETRR
jgi:hypothetical protein